MENARHARLQHLACIKNNYIDILFFSMVSYKSTTEFRIIKYNTKPLTRYIKCHSDRSGGILLVDINKVSQLE